MSIALTFLAKIVINKSAFLCHSIVTELHWFSNLSNRRHLLIEFPPLDQSPT